MSLIDTMEELTPRGTWMAFSDQDDVWLPDRLARGVAALGGHSGPALYCSRTWITDERLESRRLSAPRPRSLGFRNALVQNVASGNTILLNAAAADLVRDAAAEALAQGGLPRCWRISQRRAAVRCPRACGSCAGSASTGRPASARQRSGWLPASGGSDLPFRV